MNRSTFWGILLLWSTINGTTFYLVGSNKYVTAFYGLLSALYLLMMFITGGLEWRDARRPVENNVTITIHPEEDKS